MHSKTFLKSDFFFLAQYLARHGWRRLTDWKTFGKSGTNDRGRNPMIDDCICNVVYYSCQSVKLTKSDPAQSIFTVMSEWWRRISDWKIQSDCNG